MPTNSPKDATYKKLDITCTSTDCKNNLHCFKLTQKLRASRAPGQCRTCGVKLVDFERIGKCNLEDVQYTFQALRYEMIRHYFWHVNIPERAVRHARRNGMIKIQEIAHRTIEASVGAATPFRDGSQTPRETSSSVNIIHLAQHATASCCRKCIEYWHGVPQGRALTHQEISYLSGIVLMYIRERLPELPQEAQSDG